MLIVALNPNKAHDHDGLPLRILHVGSDLEAPLNNTLKLSESRLLSGNMEEGQCCPCPQKRKQTSSE